MPVFIYLPKLYQNYTISCMLFYNSYYHFLGGHWYFLSHLIPEGKLCIITYYFILKNTHDSFSL